MVYNLKVAGLSRDLPLCPISSELYIGAFVLFGDVELTERCAEELCKLAPEHDVMITAESKGIPLIHSMARILGENRYILARKSVKLYMRDVISFGTKSITTEKDQTLYLNGEDVEYMKGKRVLIVDDVISTGESLEAVRKLVSEANGIEAAACAVLAEGDAADREDIVFLDKLPLFFK